MENETGDIPVSVRVLTVSGYFVNIEVLCQRTEEAMAKWQLATYASIMGAYENQRSRYQEQLAAARQSLASFAPSDAQSQVIQQTELKRAILAMLTGQEFDLFNAMSDQSTQGYPEMDLAEAQAEGDYIQFFEQAFEWPQITYLYYPYFWGRKDSWVTVLRRNAGDLVFQQFLQAGSARVVVPVRPGYDAAILHYLETGEIWDGGSPPQVDDPLYVSIVQELEESQEAAAAGEPVGEPWAVTVPTSLVILQDTAQLPDFTGA